MAKSHTGIRGRTPVRERNAGTEYIRRCLSGNPLVAACRPENGKEGAESLASMLLMMKCSLNWLVKPGFQELCESKPVFLHADLIKGFVADREGIQFLRDFIRPAGVVSTKSTTIRAARSEGLPAIQRVFLIDSDSLSSSMESIRENRPDAVEIMPGVAFPVFREIRDVIDVPLIAAGLVHSRDSILEALRHGADAVSLSSSQFWNEDFSIVQGESAAGSLQPGHHERLGELLLEHEVDQH